MASPAPREGIWSRPTACRSMAMPRRESWSTRAGYNARHKQPRQHRGPITRAFMEVLEALLWGFHNSRDGRCFPSLEAIAERAQVLPRHRDRRAEGAGVCRHPDLGEPDRPRACPRARPVRAMDLALARGAHVQRLRLPRPVALRRRAAEPAVDGAGPRRKRPRRPVSF